MKYTTLGTRTLFVRLPLDFNKYCKVVFGTYVQVTLIILFQLITINFAKSYFIHSVLGHQVLWCYDLLGTVYYFLSLHSSKKINRYDWTILPMPN